MIKLGLTEEYNKILDFIPKRHLHGLEHIIRSERNEFAKLASSIGNISEEEAENFIQSIGESNTAFYARGAIFLDKSKATPLIFSHEIGHHVWKYTYRFNPYPKIKCYFESLRLRALYNIKKLTGEIKNTNRYTKEVKEKNIRFGDLRVPSIVDFKICDRAINYATKPAEIFARNYALGIAKKMNPEVFHKWRNKYSKRSTSTL